MNDVSLWESMGPELWPAFWVTIQLTFYSAIGSLVWGTILAAMRVSPCRSCADSPRCT